MPILSAENNFKRGLAALVDANYSDATVYFWRAIEIDRQRNAKRPDARYLSYYGLSLAKSRRSTGEAIEACEWATEIETLNPEIFFNLGQVYLLAGKTTLALEAFEQGLCLDPRHSVLRREVERIDRRSSPIVPGLGRDHPLNRWLGKMRATIRTRVADPDFARHARPAGLNKLSPPPRSL